MKEEEIVKEVIATQEIEGLSVTEEIEAVLRRCIKGESSFDKERKRILADIKKGSSPS